MAKNLLNRIKVLRPKIIKSKEGNIMHFLRKKEVDKNWKFGEAYFSKVKFKKIKAWKFHKKITLNLAVLVGKVKFVFYSPYKNSYKIISIGEKNYSRLVVPPKIWFGFQGVDKKESIIISLTNFPHSKKEILRCKKNEIKFNW